MKKAIALLLSDTHLREETIDVNKDVFSQVDNLAQKYQVPIFHLGDVFTSRKSQTLSVMNALRDNLNKFLSVTYMIPGNHDKVDLRSETSYLDFFSRGPYIRIVRDFDHVFFDKTHFWLLPYFKEDEYIERLKKINFEKKKGERHFLLTHVGIEGVKNNDNSIVINNIRQTLFDKFDIVFIGHYHNSSELGTNIQYIGSAYQNNFGETSYDKGFTLIYNDGTYTRIKSSFPQYNSIKIDLNTVKKEKIESLLKIWGNKKGVFVKIKVSGVKEKVKAFDKLRFEDQGILIETDYDDIRSEIEKATAKELITYTSSTLIGEFKEFCLDNDLNVNQGLFYLKKKLNENHET